MTDYTKLAEALRHVGICQDCNECEAGRWYNEFDCCLFKDAAAAIEELKAIAHSHCVAASSYWEELEELKAQLPKRGEWIEENRRPRSSQFVCSECHRTAYDPQPTRDKAWRKRCRYAYCPNCGAKMMEVQE